jgi:ketosteroid isomerase-like protein
MIAVVVTGCSRMSMQPLGLERWARPAGGLSGLGQVPAARRLRRHAGTMAGVSRQKHQSEPRLMMAQRELRGGHLVPASGRHGPAGDNVGDAGTGAQTKEDPMSDLQAIADRVEIEALRGEFTDAVMMHDYDRLASLFTQDGTVRLPHAYAGAVGREDMRAGGEQLQALLDYMVQTTHPGTIVLDGDTASGRAYMSELTRFRDGRSELNYGIYHDRYQRTSGGWKFTERVYEIRYLDDTPLAGSAPYPAGDAASP